MSGKFKVMHKPSREMVMAMGIDGRSFNVVKSLNNSILFDDGAWRAFWEKMPDYEIIPVEEPLPDRLSIDLDRIYAEFPGRACRLDDHPEITRRINVCLAWHKTAKEALESIAKDFSGYTARIALNKLEELSK
jgi:hypothetical protein